MAPTTTMVNGQGTYHLEGRSHRVFGHNSQRNPPLVVRFDWPYSCFGMESFNGRIFVSNFLSSFGGYQGSGFGVRIDHPSVRGVLQVMSSDFLVNNYNANRPKFNCKPSTQRH